jgi:hypothetical protein
MKKRFQTSLFGLLVLFFLASVSIAQEQTEVTVHIEKDGKVVKDTTYKFESDDDAENAVRVFEALSGEGLKEMEYNYSMTLPDEAEGRAMVFISKDGKKTEIKEMEGDSLVWVSEGADTDGPKVIKYKVETSNDGEGEHVVVVTSDSGGTFDVMIDEDEEGDAVTLEKRVKVIVTEDENGEKHVTKEELIGGEKEVYVISGDESAEELKEMLEKAGSEDEGDNVEVIIIKKKDTSRQ